MKKLLVAAIAAITLASSTALTANAAESESKENKTMYLTEKSDVLKTPSSDAKKIGELEKRKEIKVIGFSGEYAEISYTANDHDEKKENSDGKAYIKKDMLTENPSDIWDTLNVTEWAVKDISVFGSLDDAKQNKNPIDNLPDSSEVSVVRTNNEYSEVSYVWITTTETGEVTERSCKGYVHAADVSADEKYHFVPVEKEMYVSNPNNANFYWYVEGVEKERAYNAWIEDENPEKSKESPVKITENDAPFAITQGSAVSIIGENGKGIYQVQFMDDIGYMLKEDLLSEDVRLHPYMECSSVSNVRYNETAVQQGLTGIEAVVPESEITEDNIYFLAQLIQCEAGCEGYDGMRAVGTVVVNRVYVPGWGGDTIKSVIESPNQFSPVSSGKVYRTTPSQDAYDAAYDVLVNGFRSFPAYVLSFQSIRDGYWSSQQTYLTTYSNSGTYPQYFSYRMADYYTYGYGPEQASE